VSAKPKQRPLPPTKLKADSYFYFLRAPQNERGRHLVYSRG
jgi:hypothetical protein